MNSESKNAISDPLENMVEWRPLACDPRAVIWTTPHGTVMIQNIEPGDLTAKETQAVADALSEAAAYAAKEEGLIHDEP